MARGERVGIDPSGEGAGPRDICKEYHPSEWLRQLAGEEQADVDALSGPRRRALPNHVSRGTNPPARCGGNGALDCLCSDGRSHTILQMGHAARPLRAWQEIVE